MPSAQVSSDYRGTRVGRPSVSWPSNAPGEGRRGKEKGDGGSHTLSAVVLIAFLLLPPCKSEKEKSVDGQDQRADADPDLHPRSDQNKKKRFSSVQFRFRGVARRVPYGGRGKRK